MFVTDVCKRVKKKKGVFSEHYRNVRKVVTYIMKRISSESFYKTPN